MDSPFRRCTEDEIVQAAAALAAAFDDYPWTRWTVPKDEYPRRLEELQAIYLAHAVDHGLVLVDEGVRAVIAFVPPSAPEPGSAALGRIVALHGDRLDAVAGAATPSPPTGAWELATLGVHPDHRGEGLGSRITTAGLDVVAELDPGASVALETSDERNVRLYERLGFRLTATTPIDRGPTVYSMLRAAADAH
ncbi:GNAT family N-acetyltransferase [Aeromicrobium piscarium]|uniref:GNAT family N-acetyltransferase n=1 Tax=Aeromicrobium piscarium TaxID=2590901 RepID=A0A554RP28_9ACTN|nr:GNAT family N-acetyltransferase [Aeromicrobium piscarium]TSD55836.1 GNAT family N-acetyltransferase [Aeromicrobium piscarium]